MAVYIFPYISYIVSAVAYALLLIGSICVGFKIRFKFPSIPVSSACLAALICQVILLCSPLTLGYDDMPLFPGTVLASMCFSIIHLTILLVTPVCTVHQLIKKNHRNKISNPIPNEKPSHRHTTSDHHHHKNNDNNNNTSNSSSNSKRKTGSNSNNNNRGLLAFVYIGYGFVLVIVALVIASLVMAVNLNHTMHQTRAVDVDGKPVSAYSDLALNDLFDFAAVHFANYMIMWIYFLFWVTAAICHRSLHLHSLASFVSYGMLMTLPIISMTIELLLPNYFELQLAQFLIHFFLFNVPQLFAILLALVCGPRWISTNAPARSRMSTLE